MRMPASCSCDNKNLNRGSCSKNEDQKLTKSIRNHGDRCNDHLPQPPAGGLRRCGKSCRMTYKMAKEVKTKRANFGEDEEDLFIKLHALLGNRWSLIAGRLPGRTEREVKKYWQSHLKTKLINMGIDPDNHRPQQHRPFGPGAQDIRRGMSESLDISFAYYASDAESSASNYSSVSNPWET